MGAMRSLSGVVESRAGNVAIMTALLMPVMVLTSLGGVSITMVMS